MWQSIVSPTSARLETKSRGSSPAQISWSDAPFYQQVTILLRGPNTALPLAPWTACLYNFALKYFTPGYLGVMSIARSQRPSGGYE